MADRVRHLLDGGDRCGLVAIDPAPCLDDAAFDAVDPTLRQTEDVETIEARAERIASEAGISATRLLAWCVSFAGVIALELTASPECRSQAGTQDACASRASAAANSHT